MGCTLSTPATHAPRDINSFGHGYASATTQDDRRRRYVVAPPAGPLRQCTASPAKTGTSSEPMGSLYTLHRPTTPLAVGSGSSHPAAGEGCATVFSWNLLADCYCTGRAHPAASRLERSWSVRKLKLLREIKAHMCDFLCLQEVCGGGGYVQPALSGYAAQLVCSRGLWPLQVDKKCFAWLSAQLGALGYAGSWANTGRQGPALFHRTDRFSAVDVTPLPLGGAAAAAYVERLLADHAGSDGRLRRGTPAWKLRRRLESMHHTALTGTFAPVPLQQPQLPRDVQCQDRSASQNDDGAGVAPHTQGGSPRAPVDSCNPQGAGGDDSVDSKDGGAPSAPEFVHVVSTHFGWRRAHSDLKSLQAGLLVSSLYDHAARLRVRLGTAPLPLPRRGSGAASLGDVGAPVIICGDFNSVPESQVHVTRGEARLCATVEYLTTGEVVPPPRRGSDASDRSAVSQAIDSPLGTGSARACDDSPPPLTGCGVQSAHSLCVDAQLSASTTALTRMPFPLPRPLRSAYERVLGSHPRFTRYARGFKGCIDYCFYSPGGATPVAVLAPPEDHVLEACRSIPCGEFPSDHLPLAVAFKLGPQTYGSDSCGVAATAPAVQAPSCYGGDITDGHSDDVSEVPVESRV